MYAFPIRPAARASAGLAVLLLLAPGVAGCGGREDRAPEVREGTMAFSLRSTAFEPDSEIPSEYTCDGADVAPPLAWSGAPPGTRSFVLIVDDPDAPDPRAPKLTWVHWVLYGIRATADSLPRAARAGQLPEGTHEGLNDWKRPGYGGPCPPVGRHRYFHKLYALDIELPDLGRPTKANLEGAMKGHVLGTAQLMGTYERRGK